MSRFLRSLARAARVAFAVIVFLSLAAISLPIVCLAGVAIGGLFVAFLAALAIALCGMIAWAWCMSGDVAYAMDWIRSRAVEREGGAS